MKIELLKMIEEEVPKMKLRDLNFSLIEGHLIDDPELFYTKNGNSNCKFIIAVTYEFKNEDEKEMTETLHIFVNTWHKTADVCAQYLKKDSKVRIKGLLKQTFTNFQTGETIQKIHIEAMSVEIIQLKEVK